MTPPTATEQKALNTQLHDAVTMVDLDKVILSLQKGANPNTPLRRHFPGLPLHAALRKKNHTPYGDVLNVISFLLKYGADPNLSDRDNKRTPLCDAALDNMDIVKLLLEHGADPNLECAAGLLPLQVSTNIDIADKLMAHKADPLRKNAAGISPLAHHLAHRPDSFLISSMVASYARSVLCGDRLIDVKDLLDENGKRAPFMSRIMQHGWSQILAHHTNYAQGMQDLARVHPFLFPMWQAAIDLTPWRRSIARLDLNSAVARYIASQNPDKERRP